MPRMVSKQQKSEEARVLPWVLWWGPCQQLYSVLPGPMTVKKHVPVVSGQPVYGDLSQQLGETDMLMNLELLQ